MMSRFWIVNRRSLESIVQIEVDRALANINAKHGKLPGGSKNNQLARARAAS